MGEKIRGAFLLKYKDLKHLYNVEALIGLGNPLKDLESGTLYLKKMDKFGHKFIPVSKIGNHGKIIIDKFTYYPWMYLDVLNRDIVYRLKTFSELAKMDGTFVEKEESGAFISYKNERISYVSLMDKIGQRYISADFNSYNTYRMPAGESDSWTISRWMCEPVYKIMDNPVNSFIKFLKDSNCYYEYINERIKKMKVKSMSGLINIDPNEYILLGIDMEQTRLGFYFWDKINNKWKEFVKKNNIL